MTASGAFLRSAATGIRTLQFLSSIIILGIFAYFLATLSKESLPISTWIRAATGIAGAATLYTFTGFVLTCCLGGVTFFAFLAILLDISFIGAFVAVAYFTRASGTANCSTVTDLSVLGNGDMGMGNSALATYAAPIIAACTLVKIVFILALVNVGLFIVSAVLQLALGRHQRREKRSRNSTSNYYSAAPVGVPTAGGGDGSAWGPAAFWKKGGRGGDRDGDAEAARLTGENNGAGVMGAEGPASPPGHGMGTTYGREAEYVPLGENAGYYNSGNAGDNEGAYYNTAYDGGRHHHSPGAAY